MFKKITLCIGLLSLGVIANGVFFTPASANEDVCTVISAELSPYGDQTDPNLIQTINGNDSQPPVLLTVVTKNCIGKSLVIALPVKGATSFGTSYAFKKGIIVENNTLSFNFLANEGPCVSEIAGSDCHVYIEINYPETDRDSFSTETSSYTSIDPDNKGELFYNCVGGSLCSDVFYDSWTLIGGSGYQRTTVGGNIIAGTTEFNTDSPCYDNDSNSPTYGGYKPNCNALLAPLPGLSLIDSSVTLGTYINTLVRLAIGLIVVFAVVMLVSYGFQYMTQGSITGKASAKEKIQNALIGVLIALGVFVILATINPNLLNLEPRIDGVSVSLQEISASEYQAIAGKLPPTDADIEVAARKVAKELGIPYCVFPAIFSTESKGKQEVIGHDENVRKSTRTDIPARDQYVNSGEKFSGKTFTKGDEQGAGVNDDTTIDKSSPGLGLDWRFSHGIGLTQVTFKGTGSRTTVPVKTYQACPNFSPSPRDTFVNIETNLKAGGCIYKYYYKKCNNNVLQSFDAYGDGSCEPDTGENAAATNAIPQKKYATYLACVQKYGSD